jgi:predicted transcriptional regulator
MTKKRERLEVIYDILKVVQNNNNFVRPTRLLYASNLSPQMFKEYVEELTAKKLIAENDKDGKKSYSLTTKGFEFLEKYRIIVEFIENFGL